MNQPALHLVIIYFICGFISTAAGSYYYFPNQFPDDLIGALILMPFINGILITTFIVGFFANLNNINLDAFIGFLGANCLWLGSWLYVVKKKYIYLCIFIFGTLAINIHTQTFFEMMKSM